MNLGSLQKLLFFLLLGTICACNGSDDNMVDPKLSNSAGTCDIKLKDFRLSPENRIFNSYADFTSATFINASGEEMTFDIGIISDDYFQGIFEENDSLHYCYSIESVETTLTHESGIEFTLLNIPKAYFADLSDSQYAEVLKLYYNNTNDEAFGRRIVFRKVLDMKDYPPPLYETTVSISSRDFINREFKNIEITNFNSPVVIVYYNDELGIVAFVDEDKTMWQLDSKS